MFSIGLSRMPWTVVIVATASVAATTCSAQCDLLIRESFRPGPRPHGNNGRLRDANIHDTLKDYWPQVPADGTRWIASDVPGVPTWAFAGTSLDPAEVDPLDPFNGTAFGEAPAAAVLPFTAPATTFTASAEVVQGLGSTSATYFGYTSDPSLLNNFESFGVLWLSINGSGDWSLRANGNTIIASGTAPIAGTIDSGWLHVELTYNPATSTASGRVMDTPIAPVAVALTMPVLYFGMEAHESWNVINNISVFKGTPLQVNVQTPAATCVGGNATLTAISNAGLPAEFAWTRDGLVLADGVQPSGAIVAGARSAQLSLSGVAQTDAGRYACIVASVCGLKESAPATLAVCAADFDCDGFLTGDDFDLYVADFEAGNVSADFDRDGFLTGDDFDAFVLAFEAGC